MIESLLAQEIARKVVAKKYYPPPSMYASMQYHHLLVRLDDGSPAIVRIDRYLNGGIRNNPQYPRAINADREKDGLVSAIANELKAKFLPPPQFQIAGRSLKLLDIQRVFVGKGSPEQIRTAIWLASRYNRTNSRTVTDYCNRYMGLDCNGFAGNYWGIDPDTLVDSYDVNRRKNVTDVDTGDVLIHYDGNRGRAAHIGVIDQVTVNGKKLSLVVVQSAGPDEGLKIDDPVEVEPRPNAKGELTFDIWGGNRTVYIAAGMPKVQPNG
jgi:hypothetical protein